MDIPEFVTGPVAPEADGGDVAPVDTVGATDGDTVQAGAEVAAADGQADAPGDVPFDVDLDGVPGDYATLFGESYCLSKQRVDRTGFRNGIVYGVPDQEFMAGGLALDYLQLEEPSVDRLYVGFNIAPTSSGSQLFYLYGADAWGRFTPNASVHYYRGDDLPQDVGGRPSSVLAYSLENKGVWTDRNLLVTTFSGWDALRAYDLDTLTTDPLAFETDAVASAQMYGDDVFYINGTGALARTSQPDRVLVGGEAGGASHLITFRVEDHAFDLNSLDLRTAVGTQDEGGIGDLARLSDGSYLVVERIPSAMLYHMLVTLTPDEPPQITPTLLDSRNPLDPVMPLVAPDAVFNGAAAGRVNSDGKQVLYLSIREGDAVFLLTLVPRPDGEVCNPLIP